VHFLHLSSAWRADGNSNLIPRVIQKIFCWWITTSLNRRTTLWNCSALNYPRISRLYKDSPSSELGIHRSAPSEQLSFIQIRAEGKRYSVLTLFIQSNCIYSKLFVMLDEVSVNPPHVGSRRHRSPVFPWPSQRNVLVVTVLVSVLYWKISAKHFVLLQV
jgi:hypothetical protein